MDRGDTHLLEELILQVRRLAYAVEAAGCKGEPRTFSACRSCGSTLVYGRFPCGACGTVPREGHDDGSNGNA
jgi:hypothetical protein